MADVIPSFFNKADFWAMLLPGYVTVILGIVLYDQNFLNKFSSNSGLPFDLFAIVIFIVAGPAVGFTLWQIYIHISSLLKFDKNTFNIKYEFERAYASLRLVCNPAEIEELDFLDGRHIFGTSTAIGLGIITLYALGVLFIVPSIINLVNFLTQHFWPYSHSLLSVQTNCKDLVFDKESMLCRNNLQRILVFGSIIVLATILAFGSYFDNKRGRLIVICNLIQKYKDSYDLEFDLPSTCKKRFRKLEERERKVACRIIDDYILDKKIAGPITEKLDVNDVIKRLQDSDIFHGDAKSTIDELIKKHVIYLEPPSVNFKKLREFKVPQEITWVMRKIKLIWFWLLTLWRFLRRKKV